MNDNFIQFDPQTEIKNKGYKPNGFIKFRSDTWRTYKECFPNITSREFSKIASNLWKGLTPYEKNWYTKISEGENLTSEPEPYENSVKEFLPFDNIYDQEFQPFDNIPDLNTLLENLNDDCSSFAVNRDSTENEGGSQLLIPNLIGNYDGNYSLPEECLFNFNFTMEDIEAIYNQNSNFDPPITNNNVINHESLMMESTELTE